MNIFCISIGLVLGIAITCAVLLPLMKKTLKQIDILQNKLLGLEQ